MFDYIVVGAGSAGCVVASRLSEDPDVRVLLLEAGAPDKKQEIHIPAAFSKLFKTPLDWAYETEPQAKLDGRRLYWPRGKMLGGSSSMNAMIYIRGHRSDYDHWRDLGNDGWGFEDVLPFFRKAEHQERGVSELHGADGPLNVADQRCINEVSRAFVDAGAELGYPTNDDFNGPGQEGFGFYQVTQKGGKRCSAAAAYIKPALRRSNLTVKTEAIVTRIVVEKGRATSVEYLHNGQKQRGDAEREVILCGGAINSPQLLMLSGVGPADILENAGVSLLVDLPGVGKDLQDHLAAPVAYACTKPVSLATAEALPNIAKYLLFSKGPLTSIVAEAGGFVKLGAGAEVPDLQFHFAPAYFIDHGFVRPAGHGFTIGPTLIRPKSRGEITLRSNDPLAAPAIQPNYCEDDLDMALLVEGVKLSCELAQTEALSAYRGAAHCESLRSDDEIRACVRSLAQTLYHPVGTCRMGNDAMAVVDSQLRVRGVEGLRIADASVMPEIVGGNTNAPTIMIGEKAAELIRSGSPRRP